MRFKEHFYSIASEIDYEKIIMDLLREGKTIMDCSLRMGSSSWCDYIKEVRSLSNSSKIKLCEEDLFLLRTDLGKTGIVDDNYISEKKGFSKNKKVELDSPKKTPSGDSKKYMVYVDSGKKDKDGRVKAKLIKWGDPNMSVKNHDDKARKSFLARHKCHLKSDRKTPGWWACNVHKYWKQLGLKSNKPW